MKVTPPFKITDLQVSDLEFSAEKLGVDKSKIARAAIQIYNEKIKDAKEGEIDFIIANIITANKRAEVK